MTRQYSPRSFGRMLKYVLKMGTAVRVGDSMTRELLNFGFYVQNPRDRIVTNRARGMNLAFAVAEWLAIMKGIDDLSFFTQYVPRMKTWSTDGKKLDGAYGPLLHRPGDQIEQVISMLYKDSSSRRAVLSIYGADDLWGRSGLNTPCTISLQFLVRDGKLNCITTMRSNDLVWGLTYDLFVFTMIQEYVAMKVGAGLGRYYHNAGSFHVYERHFGLEGTLGRDYHWGSLMGAMPWASDDVVLDKMLTVYQEPRSFLLRDVEALDLPPYWHDLALVAIVYTEKYKLIANEVAQKIDNSTIRRMAKARLNDAWPH